MARKNLAEYPTMMGDKRVSCFVHFGPASYVQVGVATPPTGGDTVQAVEAGLKAFDVISAAMISDDGQFKVQPISPNGNSSSSFTAAVPTTTFKLRWTVAATGAEVAGATNLSARSVRLLAFGPK